MRKSFKPGLVGRIGLGVMAGVGGLVGGCTPQGKAFVDVMGYSVAGAVIRKEIEGPRGTTVNVNNAVPVGSRGYNAPVIDDRKLYVWVYKDKNGDGSCDAKTEILGEVDGPVNLSEIGLAVYLRGSSKSGIVNYSTWNSNGDLIGEGVGEGTRWFYTIGGLFSGDFLDELNGSPDGEYKIKAFDNGKTFSKDITIFRSNPISPSNE